MNEEDLIQKFINTICFELPHKSKEEILQALYQFAELTCKEKFYSQKLYWKRIDIFIKKKVKCNWILKTNNNNQKRNNSDLELEEINFKNPSSQSQIDTLLLQLNYIT